MPDSTRSLVVRGFRWGPDPKGRTWEVVERLQFGMVRVRTTDGARVGEMRVRDIVKEVEQK